MMAKDLLSAGTCGPEPGSHDGKGSLYRRNLYRNPRNHDGKGSLKRRNVYRNQDIMMAQGLFTAGTCGPEPANHSQS